MDLKFPVETESLPMGVGVDGRNASGLGWGAS